MMDISRDEVRKIIDFLRENPDMAREFGVVINPALGDRIDSFERTMEKFFEEANARFLELDGKFDALIKEMHEGFEAVNRRLDAHESRLEEHDRKFDQVIKEMHEGFEAVNRRLDAHESRLEEHDRKFDQVIKEMHEGFEAVNRRLDAHESRLEEHDRKFDELIRKMDDGFAAANKKFEEHDRKFDELIRKMDDGFAAANKKFEEHDRKFEALISKMDEGFSIASKERSTLGNTLGRLLEDRVRDRTEDYAERVGWKISTRIVSGGEEVDMLVKDGISFFVETKSHADFDSLEQITRKAKKLKMPGMLVGERIDRGVMKEAKKRKILCLNLYELRSALQSGRIKKFYSK